MTTIKLSALAANPDTLLTAPVFADLLLINDISEPLTINKTKAMTLSSLAAMLAPLMEGIKVNGLYLSTEATNPATSLGYGTWVAYAAGRVPIGVGTSDAVYGAGSTGGASNHTNTSAEMPAHAHVQNAHNHTQNAHNHNINAVTTSPSGTIGSIWGYSIGTVTTDTRVATNNVATATNQNTGSGTAWDNTMPWIGVYIWKRIS
jgi:hypothetical protein